MAGTPRRNSTGSINKIRSRRSNGNLSTSLSGSSRQNSDARDNAVSALRGGASSLTAGQRVSGTIQRSRSFQGTLPLAPNGSNVARDNRTFPIQDNNQNAQTDWVDSRGIFDLGSDEAAFDNLEPSLSGWPGHEDGVGQPPIENYDDLTPEELNELEGFFDENPLQMLQGGSIDRRDSRPEVNRNIDESGGIELPPLPAPAPPPRSDNRPQPPTTPRPQPRPPAIPRPPATPRPRPTPQALVSELADNRLFDATTKVADGTTVTGSGVRAVNEAGPGVISPILENLEVGADTIDNIEAGVSTALQVADALPFVSATTGAIGVVENVVRGRAAYNRAGIMGRGAQSNTAGSRAKSILRMGKAEQSREVQRRAARTIGGAAQTGLMIAGIASGVATGGASLVLAASVLGGMKAAETLYNMYRKHQGKELSGQHAQQLLFAAQAGDRDTIAALTEMGVQTRGLENPDVWKAAIKKLSPLMSKATAEFRKMGGYQTLSTANEP